MGTRASEVADLSSWRNRQLRTAAETEAGLQEGTAQGGQDHRSVDRNRWHQYGYVDEKTSMLTVLSILISFHKIKQNNGRESSMCIDSYPFVVFLV